MARSFTKHSRQEVDEFDRKLRRFGESLAHRERRMLRELIESALQGDDDTGGYAQMSDDQLFAALATILSGGDSAA